MATLNCSLASSESKGAARRAGRKAWTVGFREFKESVDPLLRVSTVAGLSLSGAMLLVMPGNKEGGDTLNHSSAGGQRLEYLIERRWNGWEGEEGAQAAGYGS